MNKNKNIRKIIFLSLAAVLIGLFIAKIVTKETATEATKNLESDKSKVTAFIKVSVAKPKEGDLESGFVLSGIVVPRAKLVISSELSNVRVKEIFVEVGSLVKKGQKLAEFDNEILDGNFAEMEADYELAKDEFLRVEKIKDSQAISRSFYMEKKARYKSAKAKLDNAKTNVNRSIIRAPFNGLVYDRKIEVGSLVNTNDELFAMTKNSDLDLEVQAPEDLLSKISVSDEASIELIGKEERLVGKVRVIAPKVDPDSRNFAVKIALKNAGKVAVGTFGNARIGGVKKFGLIVPITAIQSDGKQNYLYVVKQENKVERRNIKELIRNEKNALIDGLDKNEVVILKAGSFVRQGDVVEPFYAE